MAGHVLCWGSRHLRDQMLKVGLPAALWHVLNVKTEKVLPSAFAPSDEKVRIRTPRHAWNTSY